MTQFLIPHHSSFLRSNTHEKHMHAAKLTSVPALPLDAGCGARSWSTIDEVASRAALLAEPSASQLCFLERATAPCCKGLALSIWSHGLKAAACLGMLQHTVGSQVLKRQHCLLTSTAWCSLI